MLSGAWNLAVLAALAATALGFLGLAVRVRRSMSLLLEDHPDHALAKSQMSGFGGMLSFRLSAGIDPAGFMGALQLVKPSMSLAGVESTLLQPSKTSHALLPDDERERQGITDSLIRFSLGIEDFEDLKTDLERAFESQLKKTEIG